MFYEHIFFNFLFISITVLHLHYIYLYIYFFALDFYTHVNFFFALDSIWSDVKYAIPAFFCCILVICFKSLW